MSRRSEVTDQQSLLDLTGYRVDFPVGIGEIAESMLPKTDWRVPDVFPDLTREKYIGLDIESRDPNLQKLGPGFVRRDAAVIGVAVSAASGFRGYYPLAHAEGPNLPRNVVIPWLKEQLGSDVPKIGANLLYDLEGLWFEGVEVRGPILDVQNAEPLLDEESALFDFDAFRQDHPDATDAVKAYQATRGFSLDSLAWKYLRRRKDEKMLRQIRDLLGMDDVKGNLHRLPARFVGPYAESDATLATEILAKQLPLLERENLTGVWRLECDIVPLLLAMRLKGVRVDLDAAERLNETLKIEQGAISNELRDLAGSAVDPWSSQDLARLCDRLGVAYARTLKGNPSFPASWLREQTHPALRKVGELRRVEKMRRDFVEGFVLKMNVRGRLHTQFHQLRRDEDGTRGGRFSSSNPNLQQIPARDQRFGPLIRSLFVPEDGCRWMCSDYSAQEPRLTVHYAFKCKLPGAAEAVDRYNNDPSTDYHQMVADMAAVTRKEAKEVNLGLTYGMGRRKLAWKLGYMTDAQLLDPRYPVPQIVDDILAKYHKGVPFVKGLIEMATRAAVTRGAVTTLLHRRRHFDLYEPRREKSDDGWSAAVPLSLARHYYAGLPLARAYTHKALNALIQGSAADMMKKAMLDLWRLGYVPHLTVHDEIDDSVETQKQFEEIQKVMVEAVELVVPIKVDASLTRNWGEAK